MRTLRRHRAGLLALALAAIAVVLALLALDVRSWQQTVTRDDVRFRALPGHSALWRPPTLLPFDPAAGLLGTADSIDYRRALQLFWYSRMGADPETRRDLPTLRAAATRRLEHLMEHGADGARRSLAANLLGVLTVTTRVPREDQQALSQIVKRSTGYFQRAVALDPLNYDAKQNLELILRLDSPGGGPLSRDARNGYGFGPGRGAKAAGSGY